MRNTLFSRCCGLLGGILFIWFFFWVATPFSVARIPAMEHYGNSVERVGITNPGVLYYNDVPVTEEVERMNRDTVRFLPGVKK